MPRIAVLLITLALAAAAGASARPVAAPAKTVGATAFLVTGRGYGHGVGLSQYGALGFARAGKTYAEILGHYYPGTMLGPAKVAVIRVLLAEAAAKVTITSQAPFSLRDAVGTPLELPAGVLTLGPKLVLSADGVPQQLVGPIVVEPGAGATLQLGKSSYRGTLQITSDGRKLQVVNAVGLEQYLQGVVPGEMPSAWPAEALRAQAVAARSYALASRLAGKPFDVYADVRSQVYGGASIESPEATAAVRDTAGQVVLYAGKVAKTFFYSTSGGRTADAGEVFGTPTPYLVSVPDPWDTLSPYHTWGPVLVPAAKVAQGLKLRGPVLDVLVPPTSGRPRSVTVRTAAAESVLPSRDLRTALGLRSTWFRFGLLSLQRPAAPVVYGGAAKLSGTVRGVAGAALAVRVDGVWQPVRTLAAGAFASIVKPQATTLYRLGAPTGQGVTLRVPVAPRVRFDGGAGSVRPVLAGAAVILERLDGEAWVPLGTAQVQDDGSFLFGVRLAEGVYRARVPAAQGFAEGASPELRAG